MTPSQGHCRATGALTLLLLEQLGAQDCHHKSRYFTCAGTEPGKDQKKLLLQKDKESVLQVAWARISVQAWRESWQECRIGSCIRLDDHGSMPLRPGSFTCKWRPNFPHNLDIKLLLWQGWQAGSWFGHFPGSPNLFIGPPDNCTQRWNQPPLLCWLCLEGEMAAELARVAKQQFLFLVDIPFLLEMSLRQWNETQIPAWPHAGGQLQKGLDKKRFPSCIRGTRRLEGCTSS